MAKYRVDKKMFEQRALDEQLKQVELQGKYLKDEPLKRSEVDEYNRLKAGGWVKNTLIALGVLFATAIAFIVFVLLGNMLITNGRSGNVGKSDLDSSIVYYSFMESDVYPEAPIGTEPTVIYVDYKVPYQWTDNKGTPETSDDTVHTLLLNKTHDVYIDYRLEWRESSNEWVVGKDPLTRSIGSFTQSAQKGSDNKDYALDVKTVNLNNLMTDWFKGQEDGLAKTLIRDFFYTAWPLTLVLWLVFVLAIASYAVVLVVGIRYVIRTVITILRKAGYIASDFVTEVVEAVKSEIPIVEAEEIRELDFSEMKQQLTKKLEEERELFGVEEEEEEKPKQVVSRKKPSAPVEEYKPTYPAKKHVEDTPTPEPIQEEDTEEKPVEPKKEKATEKSASDKMKDIFDM